MAFLYVLSRISTYMPPPHLAPVRYEYMYAWSKMKMLR